MFFYICEISGGVRLGFDGDKKSQKEVGGTPYPKGGPTNLPAPPLLSLAPQTVLLWKWLEYNKMRKSCRQISNWLKYNIYHACRILPPPHPVETRTKMQNVSGIQKVFTQVFISAPTFW